MPRLLDDFDGPVPPIPPYRIPPVPAGPGEIVRSWPVGCPVTPRRGVHIVPLGEGVFRYRDDLAGVWGVLVPATTPAPPAPTPEVTPPAVPEDYFDLAGAARYTKLARGTISNAISSGEIKKEPGSRKVIIKREVLDNYLATRKKKRKHQD